MQVWLDDVVERIQASPDKYEETIRAVELVSNALKDGVFDRYYLDTLFQRRKWWDAEDIRGWDFGTVYCFAHLHCGIGAGNIVTKVLDVKTKPRADRRIKDNDGVIASLPYPFYGQFDGRKGRKDGDDGFIGWREPIEFKQSFYTGEERLVAISPRQIPLEVGTTLPAKTFAHIQIERGLARWPYGHSSIYLFVNLRRAQNADYVPGREPIVVEHKQDKDQVITVKSELINDGKWVRQYCKCCGQLDWCCLQRYMMEWHYICMNCLGDGSYTKWAFPYKSTGV